MTSISELDALLPRLTDTELATSLRKCIENNCVSEADSLGKHMMRLSVELERSQSALSWAMSRAVITTVPEVHAAAVAAARKRFP
jgi:hypothetical protein